MKLSQPKFVVWLLSVALGVIGLILYFAIPASPIIAVVVILAGLALLALGNALKGL